MSAFDDGPIAPGRVDTIARQLMELGEHERARDLASIMFDWWQHCPESTPDAIGKAGQGWFWLGILTASGAAAYGCMHRKRASSLRSPRGRIQGG